MPVPRVVAPSINVTVPVIVPVVVDVTAAVNMTEAPTVDGFREEVTAVVVAASPPPVTTSEMATDVEGRNAEFPS